MTDISKTELEVMRVLWSCSPLNAKQIIDELNLVGDKLWHEKTVKTLLTRLVKKQAVGFEKQQRSYLYRPLIEHQVYSEQASKSLIERLFSGRVSPLVATFAKNKKLAKEDVSELKKIIERWEQEHD